LHVLLVVLGWVLFFVLWRFVAQRPWDSRDLTMLIATAATVVPLITLLWIRHNVSIHRRLGPRRSTRAVEESYTHDFNRREVRADWAMLRHASEVVIDIDGKNKIYRCRPAQVAPLLGAVAPAKPLSQQAAEELTS